MREPLKTRIENIFLLTFWSAIWILALHRVSPAHAFLDTHGRTVNWAFVLLIPINLWIYARRLRETMRPPNDR